MKNIIKQILREEMDWLAPQGYKDVLKKIASHFGETVDGFIGKGSFGLAFSLSGGKVLKITSDKNEVYMANKLRKKSNQKHIISYYDVRKISGKGVEDFSGYLPKHKKREFWGIIMDEVRVLTPEERTYWVWRYSYTSFLKAEHTPTKLDDWDVYLESVRDEPKSPDNQYIDLGKYYTFWKNLSNQREGVIKEFEKYGVLKDEAHHENVGFDKHGNLVYFDVRGEDKSLTRLNKGIVV
jgi:hypothetical protein